MKRNDTKRNSRGNSKPRRTRDNRETYDEKKEVCDDDRKGKRSPTNDPEWYAQTPALLRDAASIPFSQVTGLAFDLDTTYSGDGTENASGQINTVPLHVPGIMTLELVPCPGCFTTQTSPINVAATALYSFVRHANSGSANYDAPDLMMYCLAMGQVYSYLNFLQRVYATSQLYTNYNRYLPRALTMAQGVDYDDLLLHLADFRYGINSLIHKAASLACPADIAYFRRLAFLFSGLYSEGESVKDQMYMYVPAGFLQFSETTSSQGGELVYTPFIQTTNRTVDSLISYGNSLLQPILASEDMGIMSGDILKAYGSDKVLKLQTIPEVLQIMPTTDLNVLEQFQNANWANGDPLISVTQSQQYGTIRIRAASAAGTGFGDASTNKHVLTTILTEPGPGDVIERTRLMAGYQNTTADDLGTGFVNDIYAASEFATHLAIWSLDENGQPTKTLVPSVYIISSTITAGAALSALDIHCLLENFKFHPAVFYYSTINANSTVFVNMALDFDNYAIIDDQTLQRMHDAAMLSLFNVPSIAKAQ